MQKKYTVAWIIWALLFGVIEWRAIADRRPGDTLSEHIWRLIGTKGGTKTGINWFFRVVLGVLFVWLIPHFFTAGV